MCFNNDKDIHTWYWSIATPEECDKHIDKFYDLSLSALEQAHFNHSMDNPEL
jgi:hypothetical protein